MKFLQVFLLATVISMVLSQDNPNVCGSWIYPHNPVYPSYTNVSANILATPEGYLFVMDNVPIMDNVLLSIPDQPLNPRDALPLQLDSISSGSSCRYEGAKLICPPTGSIFSNPKFKYTMSKDPKGCQIMSVHWLVTPEEAMKIGAVRKQKVGDVIMYTWYYYLSYLTPERNPDIQNWGDVNQVLFQFHGSLNPIYRDGLPTAEVYSTYSYYLRPETFQAVEYITVSTSNPSDAIINGVVTGASDLGFAKRLEWADKSYTIFQFESMRQVRSDLKAQDAELTFTGTYCTGANKNSLGQWACQNSDPFKNVNKHTFIGQDVKPNDPARMTTHSELFFCFNPKIGGDCKDHSRLGPVPIGAENVFVFWKADQLSRDAFEFDKRKKPEVHLYFKDSWMGPGMQEYKFQPEDLRLWYPEDFPKDTDPSILADNKLVLGIEIMRNENTEKIDYNKGNLNFTIIVAPKGSTEVNLLAGYMASSHPTINIGTNPEIEGPVSYEGPVVIPGWGYALIGVGSTTFVLLSALIIFFVARHCRHRKDYIVV